MLIGSRHFSRNKFVAWLKTITPSNLARLETAVSDQLSDIQRFVNWPALEHSLATDLESIWNEQRVRGLKKSPQKDLFNDPN